MTEIYHYCHQVMKTCSVNAV